MPSNPNGPGPASPVASNGPPMTRLRRLSTGICEMLAFLRAGLIAVRDLWVAEPPEPPEPSPRPETKARKAR